MDKPSSTIGFAAEEEGFQVEDFVLPSKDDNNYISRTLYSIMPDYQLMDYLFLSLLFLIICHVFDSTVL